VPHVKLSFTKITFFRVFVHDKKRTYFVQHVKFQTKYYVSLLIVVHVAIVVSLGWWKS